MGVHMKIVLLFPGYGSQFVGMAKELYDESRTIQEYFEEASNCLNVNFVKLCFASSDAELAKASNAYTSIFLTSCALQALLKEEGITPTMVAGYNLGEYAALFAADGISFPDGLYLLNKYAAFYEESLESMNIGALRIKNMSCKTLEALCKTLSQGEHEVHIACTLCDDEALVTGHVPALDALRVQIHDQPNIIIDQAPIEIGLHSSLMDPIVQNFTMYLEKVDFKDLTIPLIHNTDASIMTSGEHIKAHITELINKPIVWHDVMLAMADYDIILEVGPGTALSTMAKAKYPDKLICSINKRSDIVELKEKIQGPQAPQEPPVTLET
jgi:[acyl-carrier-protein] S-malonyltransferase